MNSGKMDLIPAKPNQHMLNAGLISYPTSRPLTALIRRPMGGSITKAPTPGGSLFRQLGKPINEKEPEAGLDLTLGVLKSTKMNIDRGSSVISSFIFSNSVAGDNGPKQRQLNES